MICFAYDSLRGVVYSLLGRKRPGVCTVIYYHSIPVQYEERFATQMDLVARLASPVDLRAVPKLFAKDWFVAVTFDDALESFFHFGARALRDRNIPATVFAVANAMGETPTWADSYYAPEERVMTVSQLQSLPDIITVGSHTLTHCDLTSADIDTAEIEIATSRQKLEMMVQRPVTLFSFPFGVFNAAVIELCKRAGYERVFTTEPVPAFQQEGEFVVGRVPVDPWDWPLEFRLKIVGAYRWEAQLRAIVRIARSGWSAKKRGVNGVLGQQPVRRKTS